MNEPTKQMVKPKGLFTDLVNEVEKNLYSKCQTQISHDR